MVSAPSTVERYLAHCPLPTALWPRGVMPCCPANTPCPLQMARFVSLIPYMEDSGLYKRRGDVWCTNAEFLYLTAGDSEEHAHLLAGYFLEIGQQVGGCSWCGKGLVNATALWPGEFWSTRASAGELLYGDWAAGGEVGGCNWYAA